MKLKTDCMDDSPAATGGASGKGVYDPKHSTYTCAGAGRACAGKENRQDHLQGACPFQHDQHGNYER